MAVEAESRADRAAGVLEALARLPGGAEVLALAAGREDVELVGGAVRDLLLGTRPREIDIVLDGEPASFPHEAALFARELAQSLPAPFEVSFHERFATAAIRWAGGRIDVASRRAETYPQPGALPQVRPAGEDEDLERRDFTINAIAVGLGGGRLGVLRAAPGALRDLDAGVLRVLHERSFTDDPTRLMRLCRYAARLGFAADPGTTRLAERAIAAGAIGTISRARAGAELRLALAEPDPLAALRQLQRLGALSAIDRRLRLDEPTARAALELLPSDGRPELLLSAAMLTQPAADLLDALEYPAADRQVALEAAARAGALAEQLARALAPSQLRGLLAGLAPETVALAGARGRPAAAEAARRWLTELRHVRLRITGEDRISAGLAEGPRIGRGLERALGMRLDGKIDDERSAQLRAAMEQPE